MSHGGWSLTRALFCAGLLCAGIINAQDELPGVEVDESILATRRSQELVEATNPVFSPDSEELAGWTGPSLAEQLGRDQVLVGMGMGAIFVPFMTEERLEPEVLVTDAYGEKEWRGRPGTRIMVEAGTYTVRIGSGAFRQKLVYKAVVEEGHTTVVQAQWAGLVVETVLSNGEMVGEDYEIWELHSAESFGRGYGVSQERQSDIRTWLLPPGIYRVSRVGEDPSSPTNYITVQLNAGKLTHLELVFEQETGNLIAGGVRAVRSRRQGDSFWSFGMRLGGTVSYASKISKVGTQNKVWNVITDLRARATYDRTTYFGTTELISRNNFQWIDVDDTEAEMRSLADNIQLQTAWIYRLTPWLGPYVRANAKGHLVRQDFSHPDGDTVWVLNQAGDTVQTILDGQSLRVQPVLFPLRIGEGAGVNLELFRLHAFELSAQSGLAMRQTFLRDVLVSQNKLETVWAREPDVYSYGMENALVARARIGRGLTIDLVGEIYLPEYRPSLLQIEELTLDIRLALTRNIEISYLQRLLDHQATGLGVGESGQRYESDNIVQLRFYLNY